MTAAIALSAGACCEHLDDIVDDLLEMAADRNRTPGNTDGKDDQPVALSFVFVVCAERHTAWHSYG
jgi:hypothetical protein